MIKTDLHIHTVNSVSDHDFVFSMEVLSEYINSQSLDCIAITNHNIFDMEQYLEIKNNIEITVFPGIEIDLGKGHLLLISSEEELSDFNGRCQKVSDRIGSANNSISIEEFREIFTDLEKYILIPHFDKSPEIEPQILEDLKDYIKSGEVSSLKKFIYRKKKDDTLTPVVFSDARMKVGLNKFPVKQTYLATESTDFAAIKYCLRDKNKVHLAYKEDHFQIFDNGQQISLGLNVVFGERSSGKTVFLDSIMEQVDNVKYIKQFQLLERDEEASKKAFTDMLSADQNSIAREYLYEFERVINDVNDIDLKSNDDQLSLFLESLMKAASEKENEDSFSKPVLFRENQFSLEKLESLEGLISSVEVLITNTEYKEVIDRHIDQIKLKSLVSELIETYRAKYEKNLMKHWVNDVILSTKNGLVSRSAATVIEDFSLEKYIIEKDSIRQFEEIVNLLKVPRRIASNDIQGFKMVADTSIFNRAGELKGILGKRESSFSAAFGKYENPYEYLQELKSISLLPVTEIHKYFVNIKYKILNKHGLGVSGGERSEFNLLREIRNALQYDLLLIDEPESSFDNLFLKNSVNKLLKEISEKIPVVIVTHNSTIGASIQPNFLIHTKREIIEKTPVFKVFSGLPTDKELVTVDGETIMNYSSLIDSLEAGEKPYTDRRNTYETLKS